MSQFAYLAALLVSIAGMLIIDWRYKLAFWHDARRASLTISVSIICFLVLDCLHIAHQVFFAGPSRYYLPIRLLPEVPIEELFFLFLLCHTTLVIYRFGEVQWRRMRS